MEKGPSGLRCDAKNERATASIDLPPLTTASDLDFYLSLSITKRICWRTREKGG